VSEDRFRADAGDDIRASLTEAIEEAGGDTPAPPAPSSPLGSRPKEFGGAGEADRRPAPGEGAPRQPAARTTPGAAPADRSPGAAPGEAPTGTAPTGDGTGEPPGEQRRPDHPSGAPAHWSAADRETFEAFPPEVRDKVLPWVKRMEAGYTPKLQRASALEKDYGPLDRVFNPETRQYLQRVGVASPHQIIQRWAGVEYALLNPQTRVETVGQILHAYGINNREGIIGLAQVLNRLSGGGPTPGNGGGNPGANSGGNSRGQDQSGAGDLHTRIGAIESHLQASNAAGQHARNMAAQQRVEGFANATDADGMLMHPHFAQVEHTMTMFAADELRQGRTPDLEDLYQRAAWAHPEIRGELQQVEIQRHENDMAGLRRDKAAAARRAGSSVYGTPSTGRSPAANGFDRSIRENIIAARGDSSGRM
jgi:hypothetical protein